MSLSKWALGAVCWSLAMMAVSCTKSKLSASEFKHEGVVVRAWEDGSVDITEGTASPSAAPMGPPPSEAQRLDEIWSAVNDRIGTQVDIWFNNGEYPKLIQLLEFQQEMTPSNYDTATNLGWMYENIQDYESALAVYLRYRDQNPNEPDNLMPTAEMYFRIKKFPEVIKYVAPIIDRPHLHANHYRILAQSYERTGKLKDAERILMKYIAIDPEDGQAKVNLARVQRKLKGLP